jgi:hypothetical protein
VILHLPVVQLIEKSKENKSGLFVLQRTSRKQE